MDWCKTNNLALKVDKTKEIIVDFRRSQPSHKPLLINNTAVERVRSTKFLGVQITDTDLVTSQQSSGNESSAVHALSTLDEVSTRPPSNSHHLLQRHYRKHTDQLHLFLVRSLQCL